MEGRPNRKHVGQDHEMPSWREVFLYFDNSSIQAFPAGASAALVGVIVVVSLDLIPEALAGLPSIAIAVVAFLLIVLFKIDVAKVAVTAMAGGVLHAVVRGFVY